MKKHIPIMLFIIILAIVIFIMVKIVVKSYEKNRPIIPDASLENLSSNDLKKIKDKYEGKKQEFVNLCGEIELAVTNRILDGTVTNEDELKNVVGEINDILKTDNWETLGISYSPYWMGNWKLNNEGKLEFTFKYEDIKPSWINDKEVSKYIK